MDPNANLEELLSLVQDILAEADSYEDGDRFTPDPDDTLRVCELVEALDGWIRRGGFLPTEWEKGRR